MVFRATPAKVRHPCGCNLWSYTNVFHQDYPEDFCAPCMAARKAAHAALPPQTYPRLAPFDLGTDAANEKRSYDNRFNA